MIDHLRTNIEKQITFSRKGCSGSSSPSLSSIDRLFHWS